MTSKSKTPDEKKNHVSKPQRDPQSRDRRRERRRWQGCIWRAEQRAEKGESREQRERKKSSKMREREKKNLK